MVSQLWEHLESFTIQERFFLSFVSAAPSFLCFSLLFISFLCPLFCYSYLLLVKRFIYDTSHPNHAWKQHHNGFHKIKFSLEYVDNLVLVVAFAVNMTAGQLASSMSLFIKHMPTDSRKWSELCKCVPLNLKLSLFFKEQSCPFLHAHACNRAILKQQSLLLRVHKMWSSIFYKPCS
jgi:hypothetical protein